MQDANGLIGPNDFMDHSTVPYLRVDGVMVASNWADLTDGSLLAPIDVDETGQIVPAESKSVWRNTNSDGTPNTGGSDPPAPTDCAGWTTAEGDGWFADAYRVDQRWTALPSVMSCDDSARIYCFQQPSTPPIKEE
jgi:hypothetical protein